MRRIAISLGALLGILVIVGGAAWWGRFELLRWREGLPAFTHAAGDTSVHRVATPMLVPVVSRTRV